MAEITLTRGRIGLSNINQDHYGRTQDFNLNPQDVNSLMEARLGTTFKINPHTVKDISLRTGGIGLAENSPAYIEGGWQVSRGTAFFEFEISNAGIINNHLGVYGYLAGGSDVIAGQPLPEDIMFIPVRFWLIEVTQTQNAQGMVTATNQIRQSGQFLINDPTSAMGSFSVRPGDVVTNTSILALNDDDTLNDPMGGGVNNGGFDGVATAILKNKGLAVAKSDDNNPSNYSSKLLNSAMVASFSRAQGNDLYTSVTQASSEVQGLRELNNSDNVFIRTMGLVRGNGLDMSGFQGWSMGELAMVFPTFSQPGVVNTALADSSAATIEDNRLDSDSHTGASYSARMTEELLNISISVLSKYRLTFLTMSGDNTNVQGQLNVNDLPVNYILGKAMPFMSLDPDWMYNAELAAQEILTTFYSKYNSPYVHDRIMVTFNATFNLFGEAIITAWVDGNAATAHTLKKATYAANRVDPSITSNEGMKNTVTGFYKQLSDYLL